MANGNGNGRGSTEFTVGDARGASDPKYDAAMSARRSKADDRNPGSIASGAAHAGITTEFVKYPAPMPPQIFRDVNATTDVGGPQDELTAAQKNKLSKQPGHTPIRPPVKPTGAYP